MNTGTVSADDVRLEMSIPLGEGIWIPDPSEVPNAPKRRINNFDDSPATLTNLKPNPLFRSKGYVSIDKNNQRMKIEMECLSSIPYYCYPPRRKI